MPDMTLNRIRVQKFDDDDQLMEELKLTFVKFNGKHMFELGDNDATWELNVTQPCTETTTLTFKTEDPDDEKLFQISEIIWPNPHDGFGEVTIAGGTYKLEFTK